jgi:hypothetical protein
MSNIRGGGLALRLETKSRVQGNKKNFSRAILRGCENIAVSVPLRTSVVFVPKVCQCRRGIMNQTIRYQMGLTRLYSRQQFFDEDECGDYGTNVDCI